MYRIGILLFYELSLRELFVEHFGILSELVQTIGPFGCNILLAVERSFPVGLLVSLPDLQDSLKTGRMDSVATEAGWLDAFLETLLHSYCVSLIETKRVGWCWCWGPDVTGQTHAIPCAVGSVRIDVT